MSLSVLYSGQQVGSYRTGRDIRAVETMQESFGTSLKSKPSLAEVLARPKAFSEELQTLTVSYD